MVARAWKANASQPAARVRLSAFAASTSQALFAMNDPSVISSWFVDHGCDLGVCVVDGVREARLPGRWSGRSDQFRAGLDGMEVPGGSGRGPRAQRLSWVAGRGDPGR